MMQRLMRGTHPARIDPGRDRLDALARQGQHEPGRVPPERHLPIGMPERLLQRRDVTVEPITIRIAHPSALQIRSPAMHYPINLRHYKSL
jgi:hypothetical protein